MVKKVKFRSSDTGGSATKYFTKHGEKLSEKAITNMLVITITTY